MAEGHREAAQSLLDRAERGARIASQRVKQPGTR
jgi:hypothetical protein